MLDPAQNGKPTVPKPLARLPRPHAGVPEPPIPPKSLASSQDARRLFTHHSPVLAHYYPV
jgi:hypothetical protein